MVCKSSLLVQSGLERIYENVLFNDALNILFTVM